MDLRRYELATLAAATALKSSYCCLAHGQVLADKFYTSEEVAALVSEPAERPGRPRGDGLRPQGRALRRRRHAG